jgi:hypothetical protein
MRVCVYACMRVCVYACVKPSEVEQDQEARQERPEPKDHNQAGLARRIKVKVNRPSVASDVTKTEVKIKGKKIKVNSEDQGQSQRSKSRSKPPIKT